MSCRSPINSRSPFPEELGAEPPQLLDLAGQRHVQLAAEIGDRDLLLLDPECSRSSACSERRELHAGHCLTIEGVDLVQRLARESLLGGEAPPPCAPRYAGVPRCGCRVAPVPAARASVCPPLPPAWPRARRSDPGPGRDPAAAARAPPAVPRDRPAVAAVLARRLEQRGELGDPALALAGLAAPARSARSARRSGLAAVVVGAHRRQHTGTGPASSDSPWASRALLSSALSCSARCWLAACSGASSPTAGSAR